MNHLKLFILAFISFLFTACATTNTDQYYWGSYEDLIYKMYAKPGEATPEIQIEQLNTDIQKAEEAGKPVAPGIYAHLGFMYQLANYPLKSEQSFERELSLYPDSQVLIDRIMTNIKNNSVQ